MSVHWCLTVSVSVRHAAMCAVTVCCDSLKYGICRHTAHSRLCKYRLGTLAWGRLCWLVQPLGCVVLPCSAALHSAALHSAALH